MSVAHPQSAALGGGAGRPWTVGATKPIRVLLVGGDTREVRSALQRAGVATVEEPRAGERLDAVLIDIDAPGIRGVEATEQICRRAPEVAVVILTASAAEEDVLAAICAGARGYLLKTEPVEELVAGVRAAAAGDAVVSPSIAAGLLRRVREDAPTHLPRLSVREREILRLLASGKTNAEISRELHLSPQTVKNNVTRLLARLGVRNRTEAAVIAVRMGF